MEQQHLSSPTSSTREQGVSARPHTCLSLDQVDTINTAVRRAKSLAYLMATAPLAEGLDFNRDALLPAGEILDGLLDEIDATLNAGREVRHD